MWWNARICMMVIAWVCVGASCAHRNDSPTVAMVGADCESRGVGTRAEIEETCDRAAPHADAQERQEADERAERQRREERRQDEKRESEADERAKKAADDVKLAQANQALVACQAHVDQADFKSASDCWNDHAEDWAVLRAAGGQVNADRMSFDVPTCLASAAAALAVTSTCMSIRETSDDAMIEKAGCLAEYERLKIDPSCGPLDMKMPVDRLARLDLAKVRARVAVRAALIIARRERIAATETARLARVEAEAEAMRKLCRGPNVFAILQGVMIGMDLDPTVMRKCVYTVAGGSVATTTRDGWVMVTWGQRMAAAFKMRRAYADGSFLQSDETFTFTGVRAFDRVDGGTATIPTFRPTGRKANAGRSIWDQQRVQGAGGREADDAPKPSPKLIKKRALPRGDYGYFDAGKDYPAEARRLGIEGPIRVRLVVDENGKVTASELLNQLGSGLDELALQRAATIEFTPALDTADKPISSVVVWTFNFTLPK